MVNIEVFLLGLLIVSTLTSLTTEAIKNLMGELNKTYRANILAGIVSLVLSVAIGVAYVVMIEGAFTSQIIICLIALTFMCWLCAMVGYDKVIQAIGQFKTGTK